METPKSSAEIGTLVDTAVQLGCIGCKNACAFGMDGLEGMQVVDAMRRMEVAVPYSVTEMAGTLVNGKLVEDTLHLSTIYVNGGRTINNDNQCGEPCTLGPQLISAANAIEKATNERGVATEHIDPR